jgi:hypothetical protein
VKDHTRKTGLSTAEAGKLLGVEYATFIESAKSYCLGPSGFRSRQYACSWDILPDVLAIASARYLREQGMTKQQAGNVGHYIQRLGADGLREAFAEGRHILLLFGGDVAERLTSEVEIGKSEAVRAVREMGIMPVRYDVGEMYRRLIHVARGLPPERPKLGRPRKHAIV